MAIFSQIDVSPIAASAPKATNTLADLLKTFVFHGLFAAVVAFSAALTTSFSAAAAPPTIIGANTSGAAMAPVL